MAIINKILTPILSKIIPTILNNGKEPLAFVFEVDTTQAGVSAADEFLLPLISTGTYNCLVDWGDSNSDTITVWNQAETTHTYASSGTYTITITGQITGWRFNNGGDKSKITNISQWGVLKLGNDDGYFYGCNNLTITATDLLNTTGMTNFSKFFISCSSITTIPNIDQWNVSNITTVRNMFLICSNFNSPLNGWDTSSMLDMTNLLNSAASWNQPTLNNWDVSNVTQMFGVFANTSTANPDISDWDVSSVVSFETMFVNNGGFNQDLSTWNTVSGEIFGRMFLNASSFNSDISSWNVSQMTIGTSFLEGATSFSTENYDLLLVAWNQLTLQSSVSIHFGTTEYSVGAPATARANLVNSDSWTIVDGGLDTTVNLWVDADDSATLIESSPGVISQWTDKSTKANNATQTTVSDQPMFNATGLNSKPTIIFDGANDEFALPNSTIPAGNASYSIFAVFEPVTSPGEVAIISSGNYGLTRQTTAITLRLSDNSMMDVWFASDYRTTANWANGTANLVSSVYDNTSGRDMYVDGVFSANTNGTTDTDTARNNGTGNNKIAYFNTSGNANVKISELILIDRAGWSEERGGGGGRRSAKWGI